MVTECHDSDNLRAGQGQSTHQPCLLEAVLRDALAPVLEEAI